jgi:hypothetical protein
MVTSPRFWERGDQLWFGQRPFGLDDSTVAGGVSVKGVNRQVEIINDDLGSPSVNSGNVDLNINFGKGDSKFSSAIRTAATKKN